MLANVYVPAIALSCFLLVVIPTNRVCSSLCIFPLPFFHSSIPISHPPPTQYLDSSLRRSQCQSIPSCLPRSLSPSALAVCVVLRTRCWRPLLSSRAQCFIAHHRGHCSAWNRSAWPHSIVQSAHLSHSSCHLPPVQRLLSSLCKPSAGD